MQTMVQSPEVGRIIFVRHHPKFDDLGCTRRQRTRGRIWPVSQRDGCIQHPPLSLGRVSLAFSIEYARDRAFIEMDGSGEFFNRHLLPSFQPVSETGFIKYTLYVMDCQHLSIKTKGTPIRV